MRSRCPAGDGSAPAEASAASWQAPCGAYKGSKASGATRAGVRSAFSFDGDRVLPWLSTCLLSAPGATFLFLKELQGCFRSSLEQWRGNSEERRKATCTKDRLNARFKAACFHRCSCNPDTPRK